MCRYLRKKRRNDIFPVDNVRVLHFYLESELARLVVSSVT